MRSQRYPQFFVFPCLLLISGCRMFPMEWEWDEQLSIALFEKYGINISPATLERIIIGVIGILIVGCIVLTTLIIKRRLSRGR